LPTKSSPLRVRNRAIKRIKEYLAEHPYEPVTVNQLCKISMVSMRTLQYGFMEHYGVTPKTYLKNLRLNNVRRELWKRDPDTANVNDVASLWGFWHMGQFAADYRKLFGELPSETLQRRK
jgi:AraC family ethanolamine operon transcriptional activator